MSLTVTAAHLLLMGTCQRGLPLENFVALLLLGVWLFRAAQLWLVYIIKLETRDLRKLMVHALLSHLLTWKQIQRGKATYLSRVTVSW